MVKMYPFYIVLWALVMLVWAGKGYGESPSVAAVYLGQAGCSRASAMGDAFTGVGEDVNSVFWNPAGLVRSQNTELLVSHAEDILAFRDEYFAFGLPVNSQDAWGINGFISYANDFEKATFDNTNLGTFSATNAYFGLSWSHAWDRQYSSGLTLKGIYQCIDTYSAWSVAADFSGYCHDLLPGLDAGLVIRNVGKPIRFIAKNDSLPLMLEIGAGYHFWNRDVLATLDIRKPLQQEVEVKAGLEWKLEGIIAFRAGYKYATSLYNLTPLAGLSAGLGLEISDYEVDYAFSPGSDLGAVHRLTITFPLGKSLQEEEQIFQRMEKRLRDKQETIISGYRQTAETYFKKGDYANAILNYQKIQALNPTAVRDLNVRLAEAERRIKLKEANRHFQKASEAFKRKDYILAIVEWNKVLEITPDDREAEKCLKKANLHLSQEEYVPGSGHRIMLNNETKTYIARGLEALKQSDYRNAIDCWNSALAREPGNDQVRAYLQRTKAKMQEEITEYLQQADQAWNEDDYPTAVKAWRQVLKIDPNHAAAREKLIQHQEEIKAKAADLYRKAVENYVKNRLGDAIVDWKSVLILEPDNIKAVKNLSRAQEKLKEIEAF